MKKLVYTLLLLVGFATVSFAQEAGEIAVSEGSTELENSKKDGSYEFTFTDKKADDIQASAKYYEHYFSVAFDESTQVATLTMKDNETRSRAVIMRFLVAAGARYVEVDKDVISVSDFLTNHLQ